jgi:hypothetical protein
MQLLLVKSRRPYPRNRRLRLAPTAGADDLLTLPRGVIDRLKAMRVPARATARPSTIHTLARGGWRPSLRCLWIGRSHPMEGDVGTQNRHKVLAKNIVGPPLNAS